MPTTKSERDITKRVAIQIGFPKVVVSAHNTFVVDCVESVVKVDVAIRCKVLPCSFRLASKRISILVCLVFRRRFQTAVSYLGGLHQELSCVGLEPVVNIVNYVRLVGNCSPDAVLAIFAITIPTPFETA